MLLLRLRYHLITTQRGKPQHRELLEEARAIAFEGMPQQAEWTTDPQALESLFVAEPGGRDLLPSQGVNMLRQVNDGFGYLEPAINDYAQQRAAEVLNSHQRVRRTLESKGVRYSVKPQLPVDVLGVYVFVPPLR